MIRIEFDITKYMSDEKLILKFTSRLLTDEHHANEEVDLATRLYKFVNAKLKQEASKAGILWDPGEVQ